MTKALDEYRSPQHKVLAMLKVGHDKLRIKYRALMEQKRVAENQVRAANSSRQEWRIRAEAAESELARLKKTLPPT
jgi:predicted  nucleic acid-binding Zn-ribbon protein